MGDEWKEIKEALDMISKVIKCLPEDQLSVLVNEIVKQTNSTTESAWELVHSFRC